MILVIDNYDSFTWNLVQYLGELGADPLVRRNDVVTVNEIRSMSPGAIVISPGPGRPENAGVTVRCLRELGASIPTLGVCLGHQAIAEAYGGRVVRAGELMHGKTSLVNHDERDLFAGLASPIEVMRYHSLTIDRSALPENLEVTAWGAEEADEIHGVRHRAHPVWGVQFHPESVLTPDGKAILKNFLRLAR